MCLLIITLAREIAMLMKKLGRLVAPSLLLLLGAVPAAPTANPVSTDIAEHPEILMTDFNPANLSIFGAHVGDPTSRIHADKIDRFSGTAPGLMRLAGLYQVRYNAATYTVTALIVTDRQVLTKIGLGDRYDVEFKLGVPDIQNDHHAIYLKKRLLALFDNNNLVGLEIR
jgi:hypothetical protein